ncbi:hypothetical protein [Spirosoma sp. KNUC1025]|uniref:hypothetical protein n=1 Tax=Spirosoma sp. KNUC1025 TaxID=2894082 RepID=UPI00386D3927|nr:hypothetical protein LN737_23290 [Spirosoma sp. KNUC1025]
MKPLFLALSLVLTTPIFGQTFTVIQIDSIVRKIDSTSGLRNAIVDGYFKSKGSKGQKGGFSDTFWVTSSDNNLVKVERGEALNQFILKAYYFYNNDLIFVKSSTYESQLSSKRISEGDYYFSAGVLLAKREKDEPFFRPEDFVKQATEYLIDAKSLFKL